jgi:hypothetical protein
MRMIIVDQVDDLLEPGLADGLTPTERAIRIMAMTSAVRYGLQPDLRGMVRTAPDLSAPDTDTLSELERFIDAHPDLDAESIARLSQINTFFVDQEPHTVTLPERVPVSLTARVERADGQRLLIADTASMLPDDDPRPDRWSEQLQRAMSTGLTQAEADDMMNEVDEQVDAVRGAIQEPESFPFTMAGREADVPVRIENTSTTPMTIVIRLSADKLSVPGGDLTAVLAPNTVTDVSVPVETLSNGVFPVTVEVLTPAGNRLTDPIELTARVNSLTGLGRVFTVGGLLVLLSWWFSYLRRGRQQRIATSSARHPANVAAAELGSAPDTIDDTDTEALDDGTTDHRVTDDDPVPGGGPNGSRQTRDTDAATHSESHPAHTDAASAEHE